MTPPDDGGLTPKQRRFVEEYLIDLCATRAAARAGYSRGTAASIGHENLRKPEIRKAIDRALAERAERSGVSADRVIRELAAIAFSDVRDVWFDDAGQLQTIVPEAARAVAGYTVERADTPDGPKVRGTVRLYDKLRALESLADHLGLRSPDLPPLEVLLNRLPPKVATVIRQLLAAGPRVPEPGPGGTPPLPPHGS